MLTNLWSLDILANISKVVTISTVSKDHSNNIKRTVIFAPPQIPSLVPFYQETIISYVMSQIPISSLLLRTFTGTDIVIVPMAIPSLNVLTLINILTHLMMILLNVSLLIFHMLSISSLVLQISPITSRTPSNTLLRRG